MVTLIVRGKRFNVPKEIITKNKENVTLVEKGVYKGDKTVEMVFEMMGKLD